MDIRLLLLLLLLLLLPLPPIAVVVLNDLRTTDTIVNFMLMITQSAPRKLQTFED